MRHICEQVTVSSSTLLPKSPRLQRLERLVEALRARHAAAGCDRLRCSLLDWSAEEPAAPPEERCDVILGVEVLNPACMGEVHVPRLVARRLSRAAGPTKQTFVCWLLLL